MSEPSTTAPAPCLPAVMPPAMVVTDSRFLTVSDNKVFILEVVLVMVSHPSNRKVVTTLTMPSLPLFPSKGGPQYCVARKALHLTVRPQPPPDKWGYKPAPPWLASVIFNFKMANCWANSGTCSLYHFLATKEYRKRETECKLILRCPLHV